MKPAFLLILLAACAPAAPPADPPDDPEVPDDGPAILRSPAEAVDLDPADDVVRVALEAAPHTFEVAGRSVDGWAYNGQVPGPTIRLRRGQRLEVVLRNALPDPTTIHWHGLHVPFAMDGAGAMTDPVPPGGTFTYSFDVDQVGTFWYHPHFDTARQVDLGLYGAIVVEDPDDPPVDAEIVAVLDAWDERSDRDEHHGLDGAHATVTVNGLVDPVLPVPAGSAIRFRWINAANVAYVGVRADGLRTIGGDQGLLAAPRDGVEVLTPGDRADADLVVEAPVDVEALPWSAYGGQVASPPRRLFRVVPDGDAGGSEPPAWSFDGALPAADPPYTDLTYVLHGDPTTGDWRINGERFPDVTPYALPLDARAIVEVRNLSATNHPFHLHGHAFELLSRDGVAPAVREVHDTLDVAVHETVRLALVADNPGSWMLHCHILPHAEGGMMTMLDVGESPHD